MGESSDAKPAVVASSARWPALDGLRAVAVIAVMACHLDYVRTLGGSFGVDVFFVLSGFLITSLLVREFDQTGTIRLAWFYARRALRLFPALAAAIIFAIILGETGAIPSWLAPAGPETLRGAAYVAAYIGNWARAFGWNQLGLLGHAWSLGIEEQFYVLWPPVVAFLLRRHADRRLMAGILFLAAVCESFYRIALIHHGFSAARVHNGLDTHSDGLMYGAALALWLATRGGAPFSPRVRTLFKGASLGGIAVLIAVMAGFSGLDLRSQEYGLPLAAAATTAILAGLLAAPISWLDGGLRSRPMQWIGQRSYGLYLWHYPIFIVFLRPSISRPVQALLSVSLALLAAAISYRFIEQPFLRLKSRYSAGARQDEGPRSEAAATLRPSAI